MLHDDSIEVVPYDPAWPAGFAQERDAILARLPDRGLDVEHVGSTAVPGLAAKPTIDLMLGASELRVGAPEVEALAALGYRHFGEYGIPGRQFFRKGSPPTHHVHWVRRDAGFWQNQLVFRDFLRARPEEARAYEALKRERAERFHHDRSAYTASKTGFILESLERAWRWRRGNLVVVDLEATCWETPSSPSDRMETIEIGAVKLGPGLETLAEFSRFVRPRAEPTLSDFCKRLTTIRQEEIDAARPFPAVFREFSDWAGPEPLRLASWSEYDLRQLHADCDRHAIVLPARLECHLDLQRLHALRSGRESEPMRQALEALGLPFDGTHHRGIDDARNIARLARRLLAAGDLA